MEFWGPENLYEIFFGSEKNIFKENVSSVGNLLSSETLSF